MDKLDLKKEYRQIYKNKKIKIETFPALNYIAIDGEGAPSSEVFQESIGALFAIAYTISMSYKGDFKIDGFQNFVVPPLEGVWDLIDVGKGFNGNKDNLKWKIMILMPDFVSEAVVAEAKERALAKKKIDLISTVELVTYPSQEYCIALHVGSYDDEPETFERMEEEVHRLGYKRTKYDHREIYLSDFRKVSPEKLKTVLCFEVEKM